MQPSLPHVKIFFSSITSFFWILFTEKLFPLKNNFLHDTLKNDILKSLRYLWNILAIFSISYNINQKVSAIPKGVT